MTFSWFWDDGELLLDGVILLGKRRGSWTRVRAQVRSDSWNVEFPCVGIYLHDGKEVKEGEWDQSGRLGVGTRMWVGDTRWVGGLSAWLRDACLC